MICNPHSNVVITPPKIYGVEWDWTSSGPTKGIRTDDAAGFEDPSPAVSNGTGFSPFDNLYPWSGMVREERTGGTMVYVPDYWYFNGGGPCLRHGGSYYQNLYYGPFYIDHGRSSYANDYIGCRLQERPPKS